MTELIVALDMPALEARGLFNQLERETDIIWFKVGVRTMLDYGGSSLCERIAERWNLMLDLKLYDTRDTVAATARRAFELGARFLTVHATPSMLEAAMAAKTDERQKVLAVSKLTDTDPYKSDATSVASLLYADGLVCSTYVARWLRNTIASRTSQILVCPGIRAAEASSDNHISPATPSQARAAGADYIVVGRPIINAPDPIAAARAIMEELK